MVQQCAQMKEALKAAHVREEALKAAHEREEAMKAAHERQEALEVREAALEVREKALMAQEEALGGALKDAGGRSAVGERVETLEKARQELQQEVLSLTAKVCPILLLITVCV